MQPHELDERCSVSRPESAPPRRSRIVFPGRLEFDLASSLIDLSRADWQRLTASAGFFLRRSYLTLLEQNAAEGLEPRYALVYAGKQAVAAIAAQLVRVPAVPIPRIAAVRQRLPVAGDLCGAFIAALGAIGIRTMDRFARRLLVCGNLLASGRFGFAFHESTDAALGWRAVGEAMELLRSRDGSDDPAELMMIDDVPAGDSAAGRLLGSRGYRALATDPDMVLALPGRWRSFNDYLGSLNAKYRKAALRVGRSVETSGVRVERLTDLAPHAQSLHALHVAMQERAGLRLACAGPGYLPALAAAAGERLICSALLSGDEILGFAITLLDGETAVTPAIGVAACPQRARVYLRLLQAAVADSISLGARRLSLGRTALEPKARLGAQPRPLNVWLQHDRPLLNALVRGLLGAFPPAEVPRRNPFKRARSAARATLRS